MGIRKSHRVAPLEGFWLDLVNFCDRPFDMRADENGRYIAREGKVQLKEFLIQTNATPIGGAIEGASCHGHWMVAGMKGAIRCGGQEYQAPVNGPH